MASQKRGNFYNQYGDRNQHFSKKQKTNLPSYNSAFYDDRSRNTHAKPQQRTALNSGRDDFTPNQPILSAPEMQTGLIALLDRFVAAETTPKADKDILHHAQELRRLLSLRNNPASAEAKRELDEKRPNKAANVAVPAYIERKVAAARHLPPLPPIPEPHLHEAVFTHQSHHTMKINGLLQEGVDLSLDYERLEFLGDAYIELIASRSLYNRFPQVDVPQLCSWRERLVENTALAKFSEAYGFPDRLKHKHQWDKDTKAWRKVVADIFEAYVAGVILADPDNGFNIAEKWLDELWAPQLLGFKEKVVENIRARDELQKLISIQEVTLKYREERSMVIGNDGLQKFFLGAYLTGWGYEDEWLGSGEGQNKAQACISAAQDALKRNSAVLQDAARKKAALMEVRAKEREAKAAAEAAEAAKNGEGEDSTNAPNIAESDGKGRDLESAAKKRKSEATETSPEKKKSKKHKKDKKDNKKEKRPKVSSDDESS